MTPRTLALQTIGHLVLGHKVPGDYAEFLEQRVEVNHSAASRQVLERSAVALLQRAKAAKDIAIEDLRDAYAVSYEMAAHRFTNLATRHLDLPVHFMRISAQGIIYKAYENDGVHFPSDPTGAIEGQRVCKKWTARMVFEQSDRSVAYRQYTDTGRGTLPVHRRGGPNTCWRVLRQHRRTVFARQVDERARDGRAIGLSMSRPDLLRIATCWVGGEVEGKVWPSARVQSHLLAAMPPGVFPGWIRLR